MHPPLTRHQVVLLLTLFAGASHAQDPQDKAYLLHVSRPDTKDRADRYEFSYAQVTDTEWANAGPRAAPPTQSTQTVHLLATVRNTQLDARSMAIVAQVTVEKMSATVDSKPVPTLAPGDTFTARRTDDRSMTFHAQGKPLDPQLQQILSGVITLSSNEPDEDADKMAGTDVPRRPGETFPIGQAAFAARFRYFGYTLGDDDITGHTTFERIEDVGGTRCAVATTEITMTFPTPQPPNPAPDGRRVESQSGESSATTYLPLNPTEPLMRYDSTDTYRTATTIRQANVQHRYTQTIRTKRSIRRLPLAPPAQ